MGCGDQPLAVLREGAVDDTPFMTFQRGDGLAASSAPEARRAVFRSRCDALPIVREFCKIDRALMTSENGNRFARCNLPHDGTPFIASGNDEAAVGGKVRVVDHALVT